MQSEELWIVRYSKGIICKESYSTVRDVFRKVIDINEKEYRAQS